jgi:ABC-type multidrug transport system fused ATPase/permease subunit
VSIISPLERSILETLPTHLQIHSQLCTRADHYHGQHVAVGRAAAAHSLDHPHPDRGTVTNPTAAAAQFTLITNLALFALVIYILRAGLQFLQSYLGHVAGWGVVADVRKHIYEHVQRFNLRFYEDKQTGTA